MKEMDSSGSGSAVDCAVGSIVWVRRRNGSWWPGKILGPDDLSISHLTSPRSGTPVKLLGREDASIDWYNLEKSKRVKAFRCGEFDDCIKRAEASQGLPPKKREKYARREDAILHALELERQLLKMQGKLSDISHRSCGAVSKELGLLSDKLENDDGIFRVSKASKAIKSFQPSHKDDLETASLMKCSRDFGLRIAPHKRKFSSSSSDDTCKVLVNHNSQALPSDVNLGNARVTNGMELMGSAFREKRSKCVSFPTDSKEIPLSLVEKASSSFREDNHLHPRSAAKIKTNELSEESESDSSDTESDSTETEPDMDWGMSVHSDISLPLESDVNALGQPGTHALDESLSSEDYDGLPLSGGLINIYPHDHVSAGRTVSKWQLKGKRNIRNLTKKPVDATRGRSSLNTITGFSRRILPQNSSYYRNEEFIYDDDDDDDIDFYPVNSRTKRDGVETREYMCSPRSASKYRNHLGRDLIDWDMAFENQAAARGNWDNRWEQMSPIFISHNYYGGRMRSILIDVDLKVQGAGYQKESVPLISLTSKVSGQAVVGHPIQVEVLEDGSTEDLISNNVGFAYDMIDHDGVATLPPAWKTARRTANSRVPRPRLSTTLDGSGYTEEHTLDQEREEPVERSSPMRISHSNVPLPVYSRTYTGKAPKRVSVSSGQRTRTLSSIAADQKFSNNNQSPVTGSIALIPCKLVFSRLLEKINRPPFES